MVATWDNVVLSQNPQRYVYVYDIRACSLYYIEKLDDALGSIHKSRQTKVGRQGRSHAFKTGGAQAAKIIFGSFYLKKCGGPNLVFTIV